MATSRAENMAAGENREFATRVRRFHCRHSLPQFGDCIGASLRYVFEKRMSATNAVNFRVQLFVGFMNMAFNRDVASYDTKAVQHASVLGRSSLVDSEPLRPRHSNHR